MSYHNKRDKFGRFAPGKSRKVAFRGASATVVSVDGTRPSPAQSALLRNQRFSYGVNYVRQGDIRADGSIAANRKNTNRRKFATVAEANVHAARFVDKNKHSGFYVVRLNQRPTDWVNQVSGLTNSVAR